ncbi:hypothetical protein HBA55_02775 [Pseudomaricurvus alkylphenolicus]|jgi:hypothetical protein|uniref:hypothetical protein n=1 Tax=Pseudomaricurvus alkylphenolicus TaxID=1306991 RepID=UPI0014231F91|nr:hypothetical protein [Pseudomaricurvus alkylphenolicus]NIB38489.1 hypothetical protein [Pseudomaricurvus alkylphenolicus]
MHSPQPDPSHPAAELLQQAGLFSLKDGQPTRRWHGALARAAGELVSRGESGTDLRLPIVMALHEVLGDSVTENQLVDLVEFMLPVVEAGTDRSDTDPHH